MRRQIVYPGQVPLETDQLNLNRNVMIALGKLAGALLGTGGIVNGLTVAPTTPASLSVQVAAGEIYQLENVDNTAYSSLAADTTDTCMKQGIQLQPVNVPIAPPNTAGYSQCYLIEATFLEVDGNNVVLPYFNSSNILQALNGPPGNPGLQQPTQRDGQVFIQAKAGIAAATGTQVAPAVDPGYIALAVVTVANGQATITAGNISAVTSSVLPASLLQAIQNNSLNYAKDTGVASALVVNLQPAPAALFDGMIVETQVAATNVTGGTTLNLNGTGAKPVLGAAHAALQGGELPAGGKAEFMWHAGLASWILLESTGGAQQLGAGSYGSTPVQFDNSTRFATTAFLKAAGFQYPTTFLTANASQAIPVSALNGFIDCIGSASFTLTLPSIAVCPVGSTLTFISSNTSTVTLALNGSDTYGNAPGATLTLLSGTTLTLVAAGPGVWWVTAGSGSLKYSPEFGNNLTGNGYQKLPSGLIVQWGLGGTSSGNAAVTFPIAFPAACLAVMVSEASASGWSTSNVTTYGTYGQTTTGMSVKSFAWTGSAFSANAGNFFYVAIGH